MSTRISFVLGGPALNLEMGLRSGGIRGIGRKNLGEGSVQRQIEVVVAQGIVFVGAIEAVAGDESIAHGGHFVFVPPGVIDLKVSERQAEQEKGGEPEPSPRFSMAKATKQQAIRAMMDIQRQGNCTKRNLGR